MVTGMVPTSRKNTRELHGKTQSSSLPWWKPKTRQPAPSQQRVSTGPVPTTNGGATTSSQKEAEATFRAVFRAELAIALLCHARGADLQLPAGLES
mmetsp:Transcript_9981/g.15616  ORF Transcript_9981/g.15616 Transcript_9981/m.15616 type:complete len:96 (+) Transcript_9981:1410-1697(+)